MASESLWCLKVCWDVFFSTDLISSQFNGFGNMGRNHLQLSTASPDWTGLDHLKFWTMSVDNQKSTTALKVKLWIKIVCTFLRGASLKQVDSHCNFDSFDWGIASHVEQLLCAISIYRTRNGCKHQTKLSSKWTVKLPIPSFQQSSIRAPSDWWYWLMPYCISLITRIYM